MHYRDATKIFDWWTNPARNPSNPAIGFVSPVVSTVVAAAAIMHPKIKSIECAPGCKQYADMIGLTEAIRGEHPVGLESALEGATLSRLARLSHEEHVDCCNRVIADLLHNTLGGEDNAGFINAVTKVVGELHDNVPSHAAGTGFSAAQVYCTEESCRLEFAIADCGRGMLHNVARVEPSVTDHRQAIEWCLKRGNTTAKHVDDPWAQRLPDDSIGSPYGPSVATFNSENHHIGEGLFCLTELVRMVDGQLWIWSGNAQLTIGPDARRVARISDITWNGLAIELELDLGRAQALQDSHLSKELQDIAERLGL